jgi:ABC-type molybdate transport system permease subunit
LSLLILETPLAKSIRKRDAKRKQVKDDLLPLSKPNFVIIGIGVATVFAGYAAMLEGSVEGFLPLVLAPILLVLGYCVIIPFGILYKKSFHGNELTAPGQQTKGT